MYMNIIILYIYRQFKMIEKDNKKNHEKYILHIHTNCTAFRVFVHPKNEK